MDLKRLEKSTAAVIFQTGIVDIGFGLVFLVSALAMFFDDFRYYIYILYIVPLIFIVLAKKYLVDPRMGVVELARKRIRKNRVLMVSVTIFLVVMVALTFLGNPNAVGQSINPRWIISGIIFAICISIAYFLEYNRMYFYAFLMAGAFNISEVIREHPGWNSESGYAYLVASGIMVVIGCFLLVHFLNKYRLREDPA